MTPKSYESGRYAVSTIASSSPIVPRKGLGNRTTSCTSTSSRRGGGPIDVDDVDETWNSDDDELCSPGWEQFQPNIENIQSLQQPEQYPQQAVTPNGENNNNNSPTGRRKYTGGPIDLDEELSFDETYVKEILEVEEEDHLVGWKSNSVISSSSTSPRGVMQEAENSSVIQSFEAVQSNDIRSPPMIIPITTPYHSTTKPIPKLQKSKRDTPNIKNYNINDNVKSNSPRNRQGIPVANNGVVQPRNLQSSPVVQDAVKTANTLGSDDGSLLLVMPPVVGRIQNTELREIGSPSNRSNASGGTSVYDGVEDDDNIVGTNKDNNYDVDDDDDDDNSQKWELQSGSAEWRSIVHKVAMSPETAIIPTIEQNKIKSTKTTSTTNTEINKWQEIAPVLTSQATSSAHARKNEPIDLDDVEVDFDDIPTLSNKELYSIGRLGIAKMPTTSKVVTPQSRPVSTQIKSRRGTSDTDDEYDDYDDDDYDDDDRVDDRDNHKDIPVSASTSFLRRLTACVAPMSPNDSFEQKQRQKQHQQKQQQQGTTGPSSSSYFGSTFALPILCGRPQNVFFEDQSEVTSKNQSSIQVVTSPSELEYKRMKDSFVGATITKQRSTPTAILTTPSSTKKRNNDLACGAFSSIPITPSRSSSRVSSYPSSILSSDVGSGYRGSSSAFSTPSDVLSSPYSQPPTTRLRQSSYNTTTNNTNTNNCTSTNKLLHNGNGGGGCRGSGSTVTTKSSQDYQNQLDDDIPTRNTGNQNYDSNHNHHNQQRQRQQQLLQQFNTSRDSGNELHFL